MKVAFIASGNGKTDSGMSPIVFNQGKSLEKRGILVEYYGIKGKGVLGYIKNIKEIRYFLKQDRYDIIHSHYSLTSIVVSIANIGLRIPQVSSLMGSDIQTSFIMKNIIKLFSLIFWRETIVKSEDMKKKIGLNGCVVIPNGVDLDELIPDDQYKYKKIVGFNLNKNQIVWVSNPNRFEKNFELAEESVKILDNANIELIVVTGKSYNKVKEFMLASDMLLLSSMWEGSPNVIKEAMALNIPIVSTNVGDVKEIISGTEGCLVVDQNVDEVSKAIKECLNFGKRTKGRLMINHLDSKIIADKIINLYIQLL